MLPTSDGEVWDPDDPPAPLLDQAVDGEDLLYRHIVDAGYEPQWLGSYDLDFTGTPDDKRILGIVTRARIIQQVRAELGLPPNDGGKSLEYQAYHDAAVWTFGLDVFSALLAVYGGTAIRGLFALRGGGAVAEFTAAGPEITQPTVILATNLKRIADYQAVADTTSLGNSYRALQLLRRVDWMDEAVKSSAFDQLINVSAELGIRFGREFVEQSLKVPLDAAHRICCDGAPLTGGAATGIFDDVFDPLDGSGRIIILEAKGGLSYKNPAARFAAGRKVTLSTGMQVHAMQGTREYIEGIALQMQNLGRTAQQRQAGTRILEALAENTGKLEYYFTTARWTKRRPRFVGRAIGRGLVWGSTPIVRIFKTAF